MNSSSTCQYSATGDFACDNKESFHSRSDDPNAGNNPDNYPTCIRTGCSAGKPCTSASGCLNGMACTNGICSIPKYLKDKEPEYKHSESVKKQDEQEKPWWAWFFWWW